jgi:hypothetical protein
MPAKKYIVTLTGEKKNPWIGNQQGKTERSKEKTGAGVVVSR